MDDNMDQAVHNVIEAIHAAKRVTRSEWDRFDLASVLPVAAMLMQEYARLEAIQDEEAEKDELRRRRPN